MINLRYGTSRAFPSLTLRALDCFTKPSLSFTLDGFSFPIHSTAAVVMMDLTVVSTPRDQVDLGS